MFVSFLGASLFSCLSPNVLKLLKNVFFLAGMIRGPSSLKGGDRTF